MYLSLVIVLDLQFSFYQDIVLMNEFVNLKMIVCMYNKKSPKKVE